MKITPDETIEAEVKEVETIQGIRERIQRFTEHDPLSARVLEVARENDLLSDEAMVLLAYHALMRIETLEELLEAAGRVINRHDPRRTRLTEVN